MNKTFIFSNSLISTIFDNIFKIEENFLTKINCKDISIKDLRTISTIGLFNYKNMTSVAERLNITVGTLTVAINNLCKKGYVIKKRSLKDKRVVEIYLTKKGENVFKSYIRLQKKFLKLIILNFSKQETKFLNCAINKVNEVLNSQDINVEQGEIYV